MSRGFALLVLALVLLPGSAPAQLRERFDPDNETHQAIVLMLRENRQLYGDDATILQGLLMAHAVDADAILTTESAITGFEESNGKRFIGYRLASGVVFNDNHLDRDDRLSRVWQEIVERSFLTYPEFAIPADGVAIEIAYNHRPYGTTSELYREIENVGPTERVKFYVSAEDIAAFLKREMSSRSLVSNSEVRVDDELVQFVLEEEMTVPEPPAGFSAGG